MKITTFTNYWIDQGAQTATFKGKNESGDDVRFEVSLEALQQMPALALMAVDQLSRQGAALYSLSTSRVRIVTDRTSDQLLLAVELAGIPGSLFFELADQQAGQLARDAEREFHHRQLNPPSDAKN